jgi:two-component system, probable response regulator PhcQ
MHSTQNGLNTAARSPGQEYSSAGYSMPRILFVDDEPHVVDGLRRAVSDYPYHVQTATSPESALQKLCEGRVDVVVADERMPGMCGSELLTIVAHEFPTTGRILLTGHGTLDTAARAINEAGVIRFLLKPCPPEQLRDAIETALKTTPFENRARIGGRRAYLVSQHDAASQARESEPGTGSEEVRSSRTESGRGLHERVPRYTEWEANELVLQARKMLALGSETLVGLELSTRLQTQSGNVHTIGNFLASSGQRLPLSSVDRWVVRHVLTLIRDHVQILERRDLIISLNLAAQSLADASFTRFLDDELSDSRVASRFLIEVRESALAKSLSREEGLLARLLTMRCYEWGARLSVDGVGGALWKLEVLKNLPVALAKIDSRFVCDILTNRQSESLVCSAVEWAQRARVDLVATGIDTPAIAEKLRTLGVHYGQGSVYGTSEPVGLTLTSLYC